MICKVNLIGDTPVKKDSIAEVGVFFPDTYADLHAGTLRIESKRRAIEYLRSKGWTNLRLDKGEGLARFTDWGDGF